MIDNTQKARFCESGQLPVIHLILNPLTDDKILDSSTLKEFADNNFKFVKNGRKFSKRVENNCGKRRNCSLCNFCFSLCVFKRLELQTRKNQGLFGKGSTDDKILDSAKLKEFADDNFEFDENDRKFSKGVENIVGKGEIAR